MPTIVEVRNSERGPLLIAGGKDHTVSEVITRATQKQYRHSGAVTELIDFPDPGHSLTIDGGWREVADTSLTWLKDKGVDHAALQKGERVLVHGGAGGVGVYGVQLAAARGARVIATDLPRNEAFVRDLGAAEFLDFTTQRFDDELAGLDVVLDAVGGDTLARSYGVLRPGGRLVTLSAPPDQAEADRHRVQAIFFIVRPDHDELTRIATAADDGSLRPIVSEVFPLAEGRAAFEHGHGPRRPGKIILRVRP